MMRFLASLEMTIGLIPDKIRHRALASATERGGPVGRTRLLCGGDSSQSSVDIRQTARRIRPQRAV